MLLNALKPGTRTIAVGPRGGTGSADGNVVGERSGAALGCGLLPPMGVGPEEQAESADNTKANAMKLRVIAGRSDAFGGDLSRRPA